MAAEQRKLLEQLMGSGASSRSTQISLHDPKACRSFIAGICPHDLFTNTKQDLGSCPKTHSDALREEYAALSPAERSRLGFDYDYMRDLQHHIEECNRRIEAAERRLEKTPEEIRQTNELLKTISELEESIQLGLVEAEILGKDGLIGPSLDFYHQVKVNRLVKAEKEKELKALSDTGGPSGHQKLQVCDVCGAYLSRLDNDRRLADHFYGKMHLGYSQMRKTYETLSKELRGKSRPPPLGPDGNEGPGGPPGDGGWGRSRGSRSGGGGGRNRNRNRW